MLEALEEAPLACGNAPVEGYRLVWPPTDLRPNGFFVRVARTNNEFGLVSARFSDRDGRFQMSERSARSLTGQEVAELTDAMRALQAYFQTMPAPKPIKDPPINDGYSWLIERRRDDRYHAVVATPERPPEFLNVTRVFVKLGRLEMPPGLVR